MTDLEAHMKRLVLEVKAFLAKMRIEWGLIWNPQNRAETRSQMIALNEWNRQERQRIREAHPYRMTLRRLLTRWLVCYPAMFLHTLRTRPSDLRSVPKLARALEKIRHLEARKRKQARTMNSDNDHL